MIYHDGSHDFDGLDEVVNRVVEKLRRHRGKFDAIIVTGLSGQCVGFPAALRLKKPLVVLRRDNDPAHGSYVPMVNEQYARGRVLFLDDFISAGSTRTRCDTAVRDMHGQLVGQYLYRMHALQWKKPGRKWENPSWS